NTSQFGSRRTGNRARFWGITILPAVLGAVGLGFLSLGVSATTFSDSRPERSAMRRHMPGRGVYGLKPDSGSNSASPSGGPDVSAGLPPVVVIALDPVEYSEPSLVSCCILLRTEKSEAWSG